MLIDWFTVAAQIVNFLVLVLLLKHFLYGRILNAMDEREARIASRIHEAEDKHQEAAKELGEYQKRNREMQNKREEALSEARSQAESRKEKLLQEAKEDIHRQKNKWKDSIQNDKDTFLHELKQRTAHQFFSLARHALKDLADVELEKQIVNAFIKRIRRMDKSKWEEIKDKLSLKEADVTIMTSLPLSGKQEEHIRHALKDIFQEEMDVRFQTSEAIISGIELRINGYKIAWSLERYLESMETEVAKGFSEQSLRDEGENSEDGHDEENS